MSWEPSELLAMAERFAAVATNAPESDREEIVAQVALRMLERERSGEPHPEHPKAYLRRAVVNLWVDICRQRTRAREAQESGGAAWARAQQEPAHQPEVEGESLEDVVRWLGRAKDAVLARKAPRYRPGLAQVIDEVVALAVGDLTMPEAIARAAAGPLGSEAERIRVRDRLLQRHSRARRAMLDAVDDLERLGEIDAEEASAARRSLSLLRRCHTPQTPDVSGASGAAQRPPEGDGSE